MLPKAEWKYLVRYYEMGKDDADGLIRFSDGYSVSEEETLARQRLLKRGLIEFRKNHNIGLDLCELFNLPYLKISPKGEDIARQYSSWFTRSGLWYAQNMKHHWLLPIITFLTGILGVLFVQWFCNSYFSNDRPKLSARPYRISQEERGTSFYLDVHNAGNQDTEVVAFWLLLEDQPRREAIQLTHGSPSGSFRIAARSRYNVCLVDADGGLDKYRNSGGTIYMRDITGHEHAIPVGKIVEYERNETNLTPRH